MAICITAGVPSPVKPLDIITQPSLWHGDIRNGRMLAEKQEDSDERRSTIYPFPILTKTNKTLAVMQGLRPLFLLRLRLDPKLASASRSWRRNSLRSSGLHHSKKNLENLLAR